MQELRDKFIGKVLNIENPEERIWGTAASISVGICKGASVVRVHDINEMKQRCILCDIFLHKEFRGKGWGRKTLEVFESQITERGIRKISLHVFANNAVALALYEKLGYKVTGLNLEKWL